MARGDNWKQHGIDYSTEYRQKLETESSRYSKSCGSWWVDLPDGVSFTEAAEQQRQRLRHSRFANMTVGVVGDDGVMPRRRSRPYGAGK